jgi:hypothetical protein
VIISSTNGLHVADDDEGDGLGEEGAEHLDKPKQLIKGWQIVMIESFGSWQSVMIRHAEG